MTVHAEQTGTKVTFLPDKEIFQETTIFEYDVVKAQIKRDGIPN